MGCILCIFQGQYFFLFLLILVFTQYCNYSSLIVLVLPDIPEQIEWTKLLTSVKCLSLKIITINKCKPGLF